MTFKDLNIIEPILEALIQEGYSTTTKIQEEAIPFLLQGRDVLGCAQTGTGKTAAFSIPIIQKLVENSYLHPSQGNKKSKRNIKALIITPTRELAAQIGDSIHKYSAFTSLKHTVIFGGVGQRSQTDALRKGVDILVATPGRLLDLAGQGYINFSNVEFFVLDEADRMLDMGFIGDIEKIINRLPQQKQTLLFSATMPVEISRLAESLLRDFVRVDVTPASSTVETIEQHLYFTKHQNKTELLLDILQEESVKSVLVFSRTKHGADKLSRNLSREGVNADSIHGNKSQTAREKSLLKFKNKKIKVLVATDIAARGIDVEQISHVINYDLPDDPETYIHRIGRTGRAGCEGTALSFCDISEISLLRNIQKLIGKDIPIIESHKYECQESMNRIARIKKSIAPSIQGKTAIRERKRKRNRREHWHKVKSKSA